MAPRTFAAVDIGASGGRVMAGVVDGGAVSLDAVHRFPNGVVHREGHLRWNLTGLYREVLTGLGHLARAHPDVVSIGVDTWAVDYGLLDADGTLLAEPVSYRDDRTEKVIDAVHRMISPEELFAVNGLQFLPFTTIYQLAAEQHGPLWERAAHAVLLPDLLAYWLTGEIRTELTNASTTGLLDVHTRDWSGELIDRLGVPRHLLAPVQAPGERRGTLSGPAGRRRGLRASTEVTTVGSHDTASAVVAVPATTDRFAYVASGTWSLAGLELADPVLTPAARAANFTNEAGVDGRTRFLRNIGGLWLLQECLREWHRADRGPEFDALLADAASLPAHGPAVDVDHPSFIPPGRMPDRIAEAVVAAGGRPPASPPETVRCILDSLATAYLTTVRQAADLAGTRVDVIHIVGGGSQNELLCQLTADLAGLPVVAGPVEATALGNVVVQARAHGSAPASLEAIRSTIASTTHLRRYEPL